MLDQLLTQNWKALLWKAHVKNLDGVKPKSAMTVKTSVYLSVVHTGFFLSKEIKKNQKGATPILGFQLSKFKNSLLSTEHTLFSCIQQYQKTLLFYLKEVLLHLQQSMPL